MSPSSHSSSPDYRELSRLRLLYPHVPILALSATCPPNVLRDLIAILRLAPPTDGRGTAVLRLPFFEYSCRLISHTAATPHGTVKFTSPLYRKNLHYKVISKPSSGAQVVKDMVRYILDNHRDETGIVYCLSRAVSSGFPNSKEYANNVSFLYRTLSELRKISMSRARVELRRVCTMRRSTIRQKRNYTTRGAWGKSKSFAPQLVCSAKPVWSCMVLTNTILCIVGSIWAWYR
jgi:hypothetical protein